MGVAWESLVVLLAVARAVPALAEAPGAAQAAADCCRHEDLAGHVLVEEGKHASCTDRSADGHYTPGFDVTERVNDAWGVRDTLAREVGSGASTGSGVALREVEP